MARKKKPEKSEKSEKPDDGAIEPGLPAGIDERAEATILDQCPTLAELRGTRPQWYRYVLWLVQAPSRSEAARQAGYSPRSAGRRAAALWRKPIIQRAWAELIRAFDPAMERLRRYVETGLSRDAIVDLAPLLRGEETIEQAAARGVPVELVTGYKRRVRRRTTNNGGEAEVEETEVRLMSRERLLEMSSQAAGLMRERVEHSGVVGLGVADLSHLSEDELRRRTRAVAPDEGFLDCLPRVRDDAEGAT